MKTPHHILRATAVFVFATATAAAGIPVRSGQAGATVIPELFEGEVEDVGPQYLLLPAQRELPLELWTEVEITATTNATLVETDPHSSTLTSLQGGGTWRTTARPWRGGELRFDAGFRGQSYRYGLPSGRKRKINFLEIDRNDFDLIGAHVQATWRRDGWLALGSLRGASLRNRANNRVFYQEGSGEWQVFRQWATGARRSFIAGLEGAVRWSHTDSFGLLPRGWNNRIEQSLVGAIDQGIIGRWRLQPAVRVQGSHYTHRDRDRQDVHASLRLGVVRALGTTGEFRFGVGYDRRESSEPVIADFAKWDVGLSGGALWQF